MFNKEFFYGSAVKRTIMRFLEIFIISGIIGLLSSPDVQVLLPAGAIGIVATILKGLREYQDNKVE
jgi:uncharacterized membrane protein